MTKKGTPLSISPGSELHKFPPTECPEGHHKFVYTYAKYTTMSDKDTVIDTYFGPVCKVCREIQR